MLYTHLFRRAVAIQLSGASIRSFSTTSPFAAAAMTSPPQSFNLDRNIFNESLYSHLRDFWFSEVPKDARAPTFEMTKRWFALDKTQEEKEQFDKQCYGEFGHALEALRPDVLELPKFESYEKDIKDAETLSAPLLGAVKDAQARGEEAGSKTLLSLILLLDQMSRNIYRDPAGLQLVFRHYDRLAFTLLRSSMKLSPNPLEHESVQFRPVYEMWYFMPLMHSEHLPSHQLFLDLETKTLEELKRLGDENAIEHVQRNIDFEIKHQEPMKKFGRYPHRNEALGRKSTKEELEYLEGAETFGVKQGQGNKKQNKDDFEKSEL